MVYVDHEVPASQPNPQAMALGLVHNILMALVVFLLLRHQEGMSQHLRTGALVGLAAVVVIEGSDTLWWLYPLSWKNPQRRLPLPLFRSGRRAAEQVHASEAGIARRGRSSP